MSTFEDVRFRVETRRHEPVLVPVTSSDATTIVQVFLMHYFGERDGYPMCPLGVFNHSGVNSTVTCAAICRYSHLSKGAVEQELRRPRLRVFSH